MVDCPILLHEGVFNLSPDGAIIVQSGVSQLVTEDLLIPFEGKRVRFAAHQLPPTPPDPTRWGGGACLWQKHSEWCPAGHHARPSWLYNVSTEGVLTKVRPGVWGVEQTDGSVVEIDLASNLNGHVGRVACALLVTVDQMRDVLGPAADTVEGLGVRATDLRDLMSRLKNIVEGR